MASTQAYTLRFSDAALTAAALAYAHRERVFLAFINFREVRFLMIDDGYEKKSPDLWIPSNGRRAASERLEARYCHFADEIGKACPPYGERLMAIFAELELSE